MTNPEIIDLIHELILEDPLRDPNNFLSGAIGDYRRNLFMSLSPGDKATINGVGA